MAVDVFERYYSFEKLDKDNPYYALKESNYLLAKEEYFSGNTLLHSLPLRATLQTTDYCNLHCIMCQIHSQRENHKLRQMPVSGFDCIVRELFPTLVEVHPSNIGEPLLSPWFNYLCEKCKEYGVLLDITSNGTMLNESTIISILPVLLDIKVSFDGIKKETFEKIRRGSDYDAITNNIKRFIQLRNSLSSKATITLQMTLFDFNYKELPEVIKFAKDIGVDKVKAYPVFSFSDDIDKVSFTNILDNYSEFRSQCVSLANEINLPLALAEPPAKEDVLASNNLVHQKCRLPWAECFIDYDGAVYPCHSHSFIALGDIFSDSGEKVLNSEYAQSIREGLVSDNLRNTICENCGNNYIRLNNEQTVPYNRDDYLFNKTGEQGLHWGNRYKPFHLNR